MSYNHRENESFRVLFFRSIVIPMQHLRWQSPEYSSLVKLDLVDPVDVEHFVGVNGDQDASGVSL